MRVNRVVMVATASIIALLILVIIGLVLGDDGAAPMPITGTTGTSGEINAGKEEQAIQEIEHVIREAHPGFVFDCQHKFPESEVHMATHCEGTDKIDAAMVVYTTSWFNGDSSTEIIRARELGDGYFHITHCRQTNRDSLPKCPGSVMGFEDATALLAERYGKWLLH